MYNKEIERKLDKIATGSIAFQGHFDLQVTNPLTGRPYQKISEHNMVLTNLNNYMRIACMLFLGSPEIGDSDYFATPWRRLLYSKNTELFTRGWGSYDGCITSPISSIWLTDDDTPESTEDLVIKGNRIAVASASNEADPGTNQGIYTANKSCESLTSVTRRWDWSSGNGNGTIKKVYLGTSRGGMRRVFPESSVAHQAGDYTSIFSGSDTSYGISADGTRVAVLKRFSITDWKVYIFSVNLETCELTLDKTVPVNWANSEEKPRDDYYDRYYVSWVGNTVYLSAMGDSSYFMFVVSIDTVGSSTPIIRKMTPSDGKRMTDQYRYIVVLYVAKFDKLLVFCDGGAYSIPTSGNTLQKESVDTIGNWSTYAGTISGYGNGTLQYGKTCIMDSSSADSDSFYICYNTLTVVHITKDVPKEDVISLGGASHILWPKGGKVDSVFPIMYIGFSGRTCNCCSELIQRDSINTHIMTERLLSTPVIKNDMPMFVNYVIDII